MRGRAALEQKAAANQQMIRNLKMEIADGNRPLSQRVAKLEAQILMNDEKIQQASDDIDHFNGLLENKAAENHEHQSQSDALRDQLDELSVCNIFFIFDS